jgi:hypothetical protein
MKSVSVRNRLASFAPSFKQLWIGLPFFAILYRSSISSIPLFDFWWHLKMGEIIIEKWAIPRIDVFSYTATGKLYVLQNWLAEIIFYGIYQAGGLPLVLYANGIILAATLVGTFACRKSTGSLLHRRFGDSVSFCIPGNVRPQVISYLLFASATGCFSYCEEPQEDLVSPI